jgi:hypothetical protein
MFICKFISGTKQTIIVLLWTSVPTSYAHVSVMHQSRKYHTLDNTPYCLIFEVV